MKVNFPKNKWFIAFAIAIVVAVAAIVAAIVIGVVANRPPEEYEGDEMGVYYYDVEDGEVLLTLSTGNNFTISGPGMNKTGTYTIEGNTLNLDFFREADGTTTATLTDAVLELNYGTAKMTFLKKVNYTVSFDTNGGSAVENIAVVNGKAVNEPTAPTKENNVFLGWYADADFKTPFAFATTPIKADTTIYAKWAARTFGVAEYTVTFDLGYEAAAPDTITTISGKAYGITAPEREGYTFGGWYVSMYNNGEKLTYAYTDATVFTDDTTLFAVWYDNSATKLNAPAVSVTGNRISWTQVSGATRGYAITVIAPDGSVLLDETVTATAKALDLSAQPAGEYTVSVVALAANEENNSDAAVRSYANKALKRVTGFQVINGILVFNNVENAEKYIITIDCGNDKHNHTAFDNGSLTSFNMSYCPMQKGGINITVVAEGTGYASSTATYNYDLTLDKIEKVVYDASKDAFIWEAVKGANEYIVTVTVGENTYVINNGSATAFSAVDYTGEISVSVVPATVGYNSPDGTKASCNRIAPAKPNGVTVNGMVISWATAAGAVKYEVKVGDNAPIAVEATSIDLTTAGLELTQGQIYKIQVKAISEANEASVYSDALEFGYFAMVNKLTYNKNTVSWAPVLGVNTYKVRVNGGAEITVTDATFARVTLTQEGNNLIEVKFVAGDDESEWASITVFAYAVEYDTRSTFGSFYTEYLAVGDEYLLPGENTFTTNKFFKEGYTFTAWATAPMGYAGNSGVLTEGDVFAGSGYTVLYGTWTLKTYNVILNTSGSQYKILNIEDGEAAPATYTKNYTLPVPDTGDPDIIFVGWFTQKNGAGRQITDSKGNSLVPYDYTRDSSVYPCFNGKELAFYSTKDRNGNPAYGVKAGQGIHSVTDIVIPVTYKGLPVVLIDDDAFNSYSNILSITIPDTIELIGQKAFRSALNLEKVEVYVADPTQTYETFYASANGALIRYDMGTVYLECVPKAIGKLSETGTFVIPEEVTALKVESFRYCNVTTVVIPNNVIEFPSKAFIGCSALKNIEFLERTNPLELAYDTFSGCGNLQTITFPSNLEMKEADLIKFLGQYGVLKAVNIAEGNKNYGSISGMLINAEGNTIIYCPKGYMASPAIPQTITKIGASAFAGCTKIGSVTIPIWITDIGDQAFNGASGITEVVFEGNRSANLVIGEGAFRGCNSITSITFGANELPEGVAKGSITVSSSAFYGGAGFKLETVTVGAGTVIKSLGANAFYQQVSLTDFTVEEGASLGSIGSYAFDGCTSLKAFKIHATVTSIGQYAFNNCTSLTELTFDAATDENAALSISTYAFNGCLKIKSVVLPDHLASFNSAAFEGCIALRSITVNDTNKLYKSENGILYKKSENDPTLFSELLFYPTGLIIENLGVIDKLPESLTAIGGSAFSNNGSLVSITLPAGITTIGNSAFANCKNLTEVIFLGSTDTEKAAEKLTIATSAFENCTSLNKFVLPDYTTSIGTNAFMASGLVNFTVPASITTISSGAFNNCEKLETITFSNTGSLSIANTLFKGCTALTTANLGANVSSIGTSAFEGCTALKTVTIATANSKLTKIGNKAFYNCTSLETVDIPKTVTAIGTSAFAATADAPGSLKTVNFELGGESALHIYKQAFQYQEALKSITFPERVSLYTGSENTTKDANSNKIAKPVSVTNFNAKTTDNGIAAMFLGCASLESINIAVEEDVNATVLYSTVDGVLYTADMTVLVFCPAASVGKMNGETPTYTVTIPNTVTLVMSKAFQNNTKITTVNFEEFDENDAKYGTQLLYVGHYSSANVAYATFGGSTTSITTINLPSHINTIRGYAFGISGEEVKPMTINFNMDAKNVTLSASAFRQCAAQTLTLPAIKSFTVNYVFADTKLLESVSFASYTGTALGQYLFEDAVALESFTIPASVTAIPNYAFHCCTSLTEMDIPSSITSIGTYAFQDCTALDTVTIPSGVTKLDAGAFQGCTALTSLTLPDNLTTLGMNAFNGSGITTMTIPSKVTTLNTGIFKNCKSLTSLTIKGTVTSIPTEFLFGCENLETLTFTDMSGIKTIGGYCLMGCMKLTSFPFDKLTNTNLKTLGNNAFSHTGIKKVDLTKLTNVTILNNAFNNMPYLEEFTFGPGMNTLPTSGSLALDDYNGYLAYGMPFDNNPSMKKITLNSKFTTSMLAPKSNTNEMGLPYYLFDYVSKNCPNLQIVIPTLSGYKADDYGVYYSTDGKTLYWAPPSVKLDEYVIPDTVETIGVYAFAYSNIESIVISRYVEEIQDGAFLGCHAKTITVNDTLAEPSHMTKIGAYAFALAEMETFIIPDSVTEFGGSSGSYTFAYCPNLKSLTLGASMTATPWYFIRGSLALEELNMQEGLEVIDTMFGDPYCSVISGYSLKSVNVPSTVYMFYFGFYGLDSVETVTFAEGSMLDTLDSGSFMYCTSLKTVENIPASLAILGDSIFYGCESLESLDLSATAVAEIWDHTFAYTSSLTEVKLPENLTTIGDRAFYESGITTVYIPASVEILGLEVFTNATRLKTVTFDKDSKITVLDGDPMGVYYEYSVWYDGWTFEDYELPTESNLFKGTTSLETVTVPNALTTIAPSTFENSGIMQLMMTDSTAESALETIGEKAFAGCTRLTSLEYVESPGTEDEVVHNYLAKVISIEAETFAGCTSLTTVTFSRDLEYIGDRAFADCNALETAYIPASVLTLGGNPYEGVDADKLVVDPTHTLFVVETAVDGTVTLKDLVTGNVVGTWAPVTENPEETPAE